ncbi:4-hydroxyphenylacetate 3-monooxygenase [Bacillus coahuilensis p1.1.43]|uniref:4-hydroxyphenylacetate 3-monooxygenase n=1 Tax=Bacillus coahuilensis p1.1.43 TaxID=1150625 RepID=A0A147K5L9_9BACI|nr:4-hydroxyphenylacetate 3-hydroxylase N-terminal domain-containing protein [Bacillus coahuilensis]KUP04919.1 4-hydroxyphenylacetate 3-monooxygenase [Bacillus coahuilensis p1.1.43]
MPIISGEDFIRRIGAMKPTIWLNGQKVKERLPDHPEFNGILNSQRLLYDIQNKPELKDIMTFQSETTGDIIGTSYLIPRNKEDLVKRRHMIQTWAKETGGLMGRSPDYMNTALTAFASSAHLLEGKEGCFPERLQAFYENARQRDLSFTHTFINPQNNRSTLAYLDENTLNARIVDRTSEGIMVRGAKLLATQGGITDELLVFSTPSTRDISEAYMFSIPTDTKGLSFVCRQSFLTSQSSYNSPLASRLEEMDSIIIFDSVVVPWERVFIYDNPYAVSDLYRDSAFIPLNLHQAVSRQIIKLELLIGVAESLVRSLAIAEYHHVQEKIASMIKGLRTAQALLFYAEEKGEEQDGVYLPHRDTLYMAVNLFQEHYPKYTEMVQHLGASGMISIPSEEDFQSQMGNDLRYYLQANSLNGEERVALFRLAWELTMSSFGTRQTQFERFFFGDPVRVTQTIYQTYSFEEEMELVKKFLRDEEQ